MAEPLPHTRRGPGRLLGTVYGIFALSATGRSSYQLITKASEAPVAYTLSALAALVYVAGAVLVLLADRSPRYIRAAQILCVAELLGVLVVGTLSVVDGEAFPDESVWSEYGVGYGLVPLLLPCLALWWLGVSARQSERRSA